MASVFGKVRTKLLWKNVGKPRISFKTITDKNSREISFPIYKQLKTLPVQNLIVFKFKEFVIQKNLVVMEIY